MNSALEHRDHSIQLSMVASMIPDLDLNNEYNEGEYTILMNGMATLKEMYIQNRQKTNDIIFLLQWYQRKCKKKYGQAS